MLFRSPRMRRALMELLVGAQLAVDERLARADDAPPMALLRRRLRLSLFEWCDRARRGEVDHALLDEFDDSEVRTLYVRFPRARRASLMPKAFAQSCTRVLESRP